MHAAKPLRHVPLSRNCVWIFAQSAIQFFTGKQKFVDAGGRVDKLRRSSILTDKEAEEADGVPPFYSFLKKFGYRNNMPGKEKVLMKFIHCADIHLDSPFTLMSASDAVSRRSQLRSDFSSAVLYCKVRGL